MLYRYSMATHFLLNITGSNLAVALTTWHCKKIPSNAVTYSDILKKFFSLVSLTVKSNFISDSQDLSDNFLRDRHIITKVVCNNFCNNL